MLTQTANARHKAELLKQCLKPAERSLCLHATKITWKRVGGERKRRKPSTLRAGYKKSLMDAENERDAESAISTVTVWEASCPGTGMCGQGKKRAEALIMWRDFMRLFHFCFLFFFGVSFCQLRKCINREVLLLYLDHHSRSNYTLFFLFFFSSFFFWARLGCLTIHTTSHTHYYPFPVPSFAALPIS